MKAIVVPFDFSPYSISAARTGAYLARKTKAHLHILHVVDGPPDWHQMDAKHQADRRDVKMGIDQGIKRLDELTKDLMFRRLGFSNHVRVGLPYEQILQMSADESADLIVMGAHGSDESHDAFIGSTAQRVMRMASCPVLSVKKNYQPRAVRKILFSSNFEENIQFAVKTVGNLAGDLNASVHLTFINSPGNFVDTETIEKRIRSHMPSQNGVKFGHSVYNDYHKEKGMINAAKRQGAGMIALVTHNRKGKPAYLFGITETLLYHSDIPVLSVVLQQ